MIMICDVNALVPITIAYRSGQQLYAIMATTKAQVTISGAQINRGQMAKAHD